MSEAVPQPSSHLWPTTDWAGLQLAGTSGPDHSDHLGRLLALYHRPLMIFLTTSFPSLREEAERILLEFAEDRLHRVVVPFPKRCQLQAPDLDPLWSVQDGRALSN